jgi:multidrug transporter EmrE-like cation transporter
VTAAVALLLLATVALEVIGQVCFKRGLTTSSDGDATGSLWRRIATSPAILLGLLTYVAQMAGWLVVLSQLELSVAYPISCISYGGVALASRVVLGEPISRQRWIGTLVIASGAALVSLSAG